MSKRSTTPTIPITFDRASTQSLYQQLCDSLRKTILSGQLPGGSALPSTRRLADELGLSRTTVVNAYEQLIAEGYIEGKGGSGSYVAHVLPDEQLRAERGILPALPLRQTERSLSQRGQFFNTQLPSLRLEKRPPSVFPLGIPALDAFPFEEWRRLVSHCYRTVPHDMLGNSDPAGYLLLREALANHLTLSRAVNCNPSQILIVTGAQQAIDLTARLLLDPGDRVWIEDPGYVAARRTLEAIGAIPVPVSVDEGGIDVAAGMALCNSARLAYVTPSHQFPLGVTMKLSRRLALLEWAHQSGAWILEDDYDSELRFTGHPLPSLQGLDTGARVIYVGTFNKVLFPALRMGYMVLPPDLIGTFTRAHTFIGGQVPILDQVILAKYILEGYFERHIRRMRTLYAERQATLLENAHLLNGFLDISPGEAGMHLVGWLPQHVDDWTASKYAIEHDVLASPISAFSIKPPSRKGLLLGYAAADVPTIQAGVRKLATALQSLFAELSR